MSDPFIAEIKIFAGNFAPRGWAFCEGQLLPIAQNTALFSILGTTFGGDGRTTLGLPNLKGRAAMHPGRGPGLAPRRLGERGGAATHTLTVQQLPSHSHTVNATDTIGNLREPSSSTYLARGRSGTPYSDTSGDTAMAPGVIGSTGGGQSHNNLQPYIALNYIIALQGLFPSRS